MSGVSSTSVRVSTPIGRERTAAIPTDELKYRRRRAGDFSRLHPIVLENNNHNPPSPDDDDGLQRIPSTSTGLLDDSPVTVFTRSSGTLTVSPIEGCLQLSFPSHDVYEEAPLTEAQRIAAQYRQRHRSLPDVPQSTIVSEATIPDVSSNLPKPGGSFPSNTVI